MHVCINCIRHNVKSFRTMLMIFRCLELRVFLFPKINEPTVSILNDFLGIRLLEARRQDRGFNVLGFLRKKTVASNRLFKLYY